MPTPIIWTPYCGRAPAPEDLLARWNLDPALIGGLAIMIVAYALYAGDAPPRQRSYFAGALVLLLILFVSPFCALTSALFSVRIVHHVLLVAVVAWLLVASVPGHFPQLRVSLVSATAVQAFVFWLWHAPPLYAWALSSDAAYWLMQVTILVSACVFWAVIRSASAPAAVAVLFASMVQMGLLGALITFSPAPLYAPHFLSTQPWGFSPLEDQQLAGLIMWVPAAGLYLGAALVLAGRWLGTAQGDAVR